MPAGPHMQPLGFEVTVTGRAVTVILCGDLDIGNERFLSRCLAQLRDKRPHRLVFDMAEVGFADCAAMRLLVGTGQWLPEGTKPVISGARPMMRRVLQLTGLDAQCDLRE
jgi:anti-anti-sigma factor